MDKNIPNNNRELNAFDKLYEGAYTYFKKSKPYGQESFSLSRRKQNGNYLYNAEVLSRVHTGEFLKVHINYEIHKLFQPLKVEIKRSLGDQLTTETFTFNPHEKLLRYAFHDGKLEQKLEKNISTKFHISTPCISAATLFTSTKKFDILSRDSFMMVASPNDWEYRGAFAQQLIFVEFESHQTEELKINNKTLSSNICRVYQGDVSEIDQPDPITFHISKNMALPYQAKIPNEDVLIQVDFLKKLQSEEDFDT